MAEYNILGGVFAIQFDLFTPRPHFLILPKKEDTIDREFSNMTAAQTQQLITVAKFALSGFGIAKGILSIHRGSWRSRLPLFHAHLCVDVESYLDVFDGKKNGIPDWPNDRYVKDTWEAKKDPLFYAENVRGYPYENYLDEEVKAIKQLKESPPYVPFKLPDGHVVKKIEYHRKYPMIEFVGKKTGAVQELQEVLLLMEEFAGKHGLTDSKSSDDDMGCHLCLHLDSAVTEGEGVLGFIVTTGLSFYRLCPTLRRDAWFNAFEYSGFKCWT